MDNDAPVAVRKPRDPNRGYGRLKERLKDLPDNWDSPEEDAKVLALFEDREIEWD